MVSFVLTTLSVIFTLVRDDNIQAFTSHFTEIAEGKRQEQRLETMSENGELANQNERTEVYVYELANDLKFEFRILNLFNFLPTIRSLSILQFFCIILLSSLVVRSLLSLVQYYCVSYCYDKLEQSIKQDLFNILVRSDYLFASVVSDKISALCASGELNLLSQTIWYTPINTFVSVFQLIHILAGFKFGDYKSLLVFVLTSLIASCAVVFYFLLRKAAKLNVAATKRVRDDSLIISEKIGNLEYIKMESSEEYEVKELDQRLDGTFEKNKKSLFWTVVFRALPSWMFFPNVGFLFCTVLLLLREWFEGMPKLMYTISNFISNFNYIKRTFSILSKFVEELEGIDDRIAFLYVVQSQVKYLYCNSRDTKTSFLPFSNGDIVFDQVTFSYPARREIKVLQEISFCFEKGKKIGIVGDNGIGKSTITKTLVKLFDIESGTITIDGTDIREIDTFDLHRHLCYQSNRPFFFGSSIAKNVYYPFDCPLDYQEQLATVAEKVGLTKFISKLPEGFDTILTPGGSNLSEGQKQQVALMRLFVRDYDIFILDEIISNMHPYLKETVLQNVFDHLKEKTVLVIDHHYKIFEYVDCVYQFNRDSLTEKNKDYL